MKRRRQPEDRRMRGKLPRRPPPPRRARPKPQRPVEPAQPPPGWERRSKQAHLQRLAREQIQARELEEALDRWRHTPSTTWDITGPTAMTDANPTASGRVVIRIYYGPAITNFY